MYPNGPGGTGANLSRGQAVACEIHVIRARELRELVTYGVGFLQRRRGQFFQLADRPERSRSPAYDSDATARRGEGNAPERLRLGPVGSRHELELAEHRAEHDVHLEQGERRPDASADAAAERDPRVRVGLAADVAVRVEARRVLVE